MQLARVVGEVVSTVKDPNLIGMKLLVLQPLNAAGEAAGRTLVALDSVGCGAPGTLMQLARVIGEVVATIKDDNLTGIKLMVLQPIAASGDPAGRTLVALDSVGAGVGEHVFFVRGREAAFPFYPVEPPTDATIVGIVDHWSMT